MIDIKELRQLAQAATPGPWKVGQYLGSPRQFVIHMDVGDKGRGSDVAFTSANFGNDETIANARLIAAANPAAIFELLDRLEAAEKDRVIDEQRIADLMADLNRVGHENDALRAELDALRNQEPVAWMHETRRDSDVVTDAVKHVWGKVAVGSMAAYSIPLYALPVAQPTPSVPTDVITDYLVSISAHLAHQDNRKAQAEIGELLKMLAAAPEIKP